MEAASAANTEDFFQISVMELEDLAYVLKRVLQMCLSFKARPDARTWIVGLVTFKEANSYW